MTILMLKKSEFKIVYYSIVITNTIIKFYFYFRIISRDTKKMESKSEKYFRILKSLKYPDIDSLNPKIFDYLFLIPDTQKFFDWFLDNVDETCLINDKAKYLDMASRGQVLQDMDKIIEMNKLISSSSSNDLIVLSNNQIKQNSDLIVVNFLLFQGQRRR